MKEVSTNDVHSWHKHIVCLYRHANESVLIYYPNYTDNGTVLKRIKVRRKYSDQRTFLLTDQEAIDMILPRII